MISTTKTSIRFFVKIGLWLCMATLSAACSCSGPRSTAKNAIEQTREDPQLYTRGIDIPILNDSIPQQLLYRKAYITSYNKETRCPNWVAWKLTAEHVNGNVQRPGTAWHEDVEVPTPRADNNDYRNSGWTRGHMCPAADNKWDETAMYESFLFTNACPQHKALNSGDWNEIEISCRQWAKKYGEIIIICGPLFLKQEHQTTGAHKVLIPEAFFKVIVCLDPEHPRGIGFICRNNEGNRNKDFYTNSIKQVERITGIQFFPNLPESMITAVKNNDDINQF